MALVEQCHAQEMGVAEFSHMRTLPFCCQAIFWLFYVANRWEVSQIIKLFLDGAEPFSIRTYLLLQVLFYPTL